MDGKDYDFRNDTGTYQTGRTQPPRHHRGLLAFLIGLVILLSGISTCLSILNLKLYRRLTTEQAVSRVTFFQSQGESLPPEEVHEEVRELQEHLGICGMMIPRVYQRFYKLPMGIYVTQVVGGSEAQSKGIVAGDIITALNGTAIQSGSLHDLFEVCPEEGETVELTLYRADAELTLQLTWGDYEE